MQQENNIKSHSDWQNNFRIKDMSSRRHEQQQKSMNSNIKKYLATACALYISIISNQVFAWTASAISENDYVFTQFDSPDPENALGLAIEACERNSNSKCIKFVNVVRKTATVIVKSEDESTYLISNQDPMKAANQSLKNCKVGEKIGCRVASVNWDSGSTWAALAMGNDNYHYIYNVETEQSATKDALKACEEIVTEKNSCNAIKSFIVNRRAYFATANSKTTTHFGISDEKSVAENMAIEGCRKETTDSSPCHILNVVLNDGPTPPPASYKQVEAMAKIDPPPKARPTGPTTTSINRLSYTNNCINGSCVREFPNGRTERWQEPRVMNPLTQNWV